MRRAIPTISSDTFATRRARRRCWRIVAAGDVYQSQFHGFRSHLSAVSSASAEFDAIYNARFVPGKRHELASQIESVAYVAYCEGNASRQEEFKRLWSETKARSPSHVLLNDLADDLPVRNLS